MTLKPLLEKVLKQGVSDIHLKANEPPMVRYIGQLASIGTKTIQQEDIEAILKEMLTEWQRKKFEESGNLDFAHSYDGIGRLRINVYRQRGGLAMAIRIIPPKAKTFDELHLPKETFEKLSQSSRGLILISGVTGAGKTTTLNALLNYMNEHFSYNIITLEDPVEFVHNRNKCSISQREVGRDVPSFSEGLKFVFRQDPDVIVLGEAMTPDTFQAAIEGAASGHLVLTTIHSSDALDVIDRIVNAFDFQQQPYVRLQLTNVIRAIVSQRLIPDKNNTGCLPATETLFGSLQLKKLLSSGGTAEAKFLIEKGGAYGMHTFDQDLLRMVTEGAITPQEALNNSSNPNDLRIKLQGQGDSSLESIK
jgi:twitching motility protein PilT